jgi:protein TonB
MALIVLLHVGFFYALTHGVTIGSVKLAPPVIVVDVPVKPQPPPKRLTPVEPTIDKPFVPPIEVPVMPPVDTPTAPVDVTRDAPPISHEGFQDLTGSPPVVVGPQLDARHPFTEPPYPTSEIRMGHEGTVLLRVQILPSGLVGAVELERSSGFPRLDESAMREARTWRMKPGTHGGVATAMWTVVPIKFQLKN